MYEIDYACHVMKKGDILVTFCCQEYHEGNIAAAADGPITEQQIKLVDLGPPYLFCLYQTYLDISSAKIQNCLIFYLAHIK